MKKLTIDNVTINDLQSLNYNKESIETIEYLIEWYTDVNCHIFKGYKVDFKHWLIAFHMYQNYVVKDNIGLSTVDKECAIGVENFDAGSQTDTIVREIMRDFVQKMIKPKSFEKSIISPIPRLNGKYEYSHFWVSNDRVFNIMKSVAEQDIEYILSGTSKQDKVKKRWGIDLYIKIGSSYKVNEPLTEGGA